MKIELIPASFEDIPAILAIERDSQPEPWSEELFRGEMRWPHSRIVVAGASERPDKLLGYICFWKVADEIQVHNLAVHRDYRRHGIGRALLQWALRFGLASSARVAVLEVRTNNQGAQEFYESFGFRAVGKRPDYYASGEAAIIMELEFEPLRREMNESDDRTRSDSI
jgi:[ribosomal protein S18]-alanine N-acetyltransferase